jgi:VIT1/CCC1 family predicted Fe2+/Mn2+ transporter
VTNILPWLTPLAAAGLVLTILGAMATHLRRSEFPNIIPNLVLLALALVVIYGRFVAVPL